MTQLCASATARLIAELANGLPLASGQRRDITIGEARLLSGVGYPANGATPSSTP